MSTDAHGATPTTRKRSRAAAMQANDPAAPGAPGQQPTAEDGFVVDNDAVDSAGDDDEEEGGKPDKKAGRRKIKIEFIADKSRRHITFSKRKAGIMKKAYELSTLTGTQVLLLVVSETGLVYTFTTAKLQPLVTQPEGKNLIQACLNAPHGALPSNMPVGAPLGRSAPQQIQTPAPPQQQQQPGPPMSGMPPQMGQARNVPGGLAIGNPGGAPSGPGGQGDDADGERDAHDEADAEGEKRGAARRRTSGAGKNSASANNAQGGGARSPTTPSTHVGAPPQGMPPMGQAPYGAAPGSAGQEGTPGHPGGPPPPGGMYAHPGVHHMMGGAPGYYPPPPGMAGAWGPPPQGGPPPQNAYGRR